MKFWFVFEVTTYCDKKCILCCNDSVRKKNVMDFAHLMGKLDEIHDFCARKKFTPALVFTGGEAFLYKDAAAGKTLKDVVDMAKAKFPGAVVYIKTSGFTENTYLDSLLDSLLKQYPAPELQIRLGINFYQKSGIDMQKRLMHMLEKLLPHQGMLTIDTIYDRDNLARTCEIMELAFDGAGFTAVKNGQLLELIKESPCRHKRLKISNKEHTIYLDMGPSYSPRLESDNCHYFEELISAPCANIQNGPMSIYYNAGFDLIHCNDSFVDGSVSPIKTGSATDLPTIDAQHAFLQKRFDELKQFLNSGSKQFNNRKDRCFFCTQFVMSQKFSDKVGKCA